VTAARGRTVLWALMLIGIALLAWRARFAMLPFALGSIVAYALTPVVDRMASLVPARSHRADVVRRGLAVVVLYLLIGLALFGVGVALVPVATDQTARFIDELPQFIDQARMEFNEFLREYRDRVPVDAQARIDGYVAELGATLADAVATTFRGTITRVTGTIGLVFGFFIVPFWLFYALRDRHFVAESFQRAVPEPVREDVAHVLLMADRLLGRYIRAQLFLGLVVGTAVGVGLTLMGVELSLALGVFAGVTALIPIIGPWLGAIPAVVIIAATDPGLLPWVVLLYVIVQQLENNLLVPRVQGHALDLHPAMIILLLVVAGAVFGFIGLVIVVPLFAILRELFWYADHRLAGASPHEALADTNIGRRLHDAHAAEDAAAESEATAPVAAESVATASVATEQPAADA
jgi:predicted PurR-regulated permease PerM